jgi:hypothetical protein
VGIKMNKSVLFNVSTKGVKLRCDCCGRKIKKSQLYAEVIRGVTTYHRGEHGFTEFNNDSQNICSKCFDYVIRDGKRVSEYLDI